MMNGPFEALNSDTAPSAHWAEGRNSEGTSRNTKPLPLKGILLCARCVNVTQEQISENESLKWIYLRLRPSYGELNARHPNKLAGCINGDGFLCWYLAKDSNT
jgi:hypothetical protein